jgi:hypothetical protein
MWFRVVAPHRGQLASGTRAARSALLGRYWQSLVAHAWEDLCRQALPRIEVAALRGLGPLGPAARWWHGSAPEWDLIAATQEHGGLVLGEAKWRPRPWSNEDLRREATRLRQRPGPVLEAAHREGQQVRVLFVPAVAGRLRRVIDGVVVVTARDLLAASVD